MTRKTESGAKEPAEMRNTPLGPLHEKRNSVFRKIEPFESCICLRGVRCPDHQREMDFLLLNPDPPAIGLVECDHKSIPSGIEQLLVYVAKFQHFAGKGSEIYAGSLHNALEETNDRSRKYNAGYRSIKRWMRQLNMGQEDLIALLDDASQTLVPILIYFRSFQTPRSSPELSETEIEVLKHVFPHHTLYVLIVDRATCKVRSIKDFPRQIEARL